MSSHARHIRRRSRRRADPIDAYAAALAATGMPDREVARAALYAEQYGLEALSGGGCVSFDVPECGNLDCLNPSHQILTRGD